MIKFRRVSSDRNLKTVSKIRLTQPTPLSPTKSYKKSQRFKKLTRLPMIFFILKIILKTQYHKVLFPKQSCIWMDFSATTALKDTTPLSSIETPSFTLQVFLIAFTITLLNKRNYFIAKIKEESDASLSIPLKSISQLQKWAFYPTSTFTNTLQPSCTEF